MMNRFHRRFAGLFLMGALAWLPGCGSNVETSSDYQKLPKAEADRRFQDTLKRRAAARIGQPPPPPSFGVGGPNPGK